MVVSRGFWNEGFTERVIDQKELWVNFIYNKKDPLNLRLF